MGLFLGGFFEAEGGLEGMELVLEWGGGGGFLGVGAVVEIVGVRAGERLGGRFE